MVGCCVVVRRPLLSLPAIVRSLIPLLLWCPQAFLLPAATRLCHSRQWLVVVLLSATYFRLSPPAFVDARHCATVVALVAGRFCRQPPTAALRRSCHQQPPTFTSSNDGWLLRPLLSRGSSSRTMSVPTAALTTYFTYLQFFLC